MHPRLSPAIFTRTIKIELTDRFDAAGAFDYRQATRTEIILASRPSDCGYYQQLAANAINTPPMGVTYSLRKTFQKFAIHGITLVDCPPGHL
jgi:hypothetical protein